jgi:hypothetical protein
VATHGHLPSIVKTNCYTIFLLHVRRTDRSSSAILRATYTRREHAHATEPPGPGHPAPAPVSRRRRQLPGESLLQRRPIVVRETEPVCRSTPDGEPAALGLVGAADVEARVLPPMRRASGDDQALVAVRRPGPPLPEGRADEREDPLHCRRLALLATRDEIERNRIGDDSAQVSYTERRGDRLD